MPFPTVGDRVRISESDHVPAMWHKVEGRVVKVEYIALPGDASATATIEVTVEDDSGSRVTVGIENVQVI